MRSELALCMGEGKTQIEYFNLLPSSSIWAAKLEKMPPWLKKKNKNTQGIGSKSYLSGKTDNAKWLLPIHSTNLKVNFLREKVKK